MNHRMADPPAPVILGLVWRYILSPLKSGVLNSLLASAGLPPVG